jgi:uncharacterized protein YjeT (DUF2065 family)
MSELFTALALALAIEGMLYALFPDAMKRFMAQALEAPEQVLRTAGLIAAIAGVAVIALIRM